ncbi:MAG: helix-turn-helix domain-containing protein [Moorellales bacterium]
MREFGRVLKETRERKGLTLEEAEAVTKIRRRYLEALEGGDLQVLPGRTYALGFLRSYIRFLGLDPDTAASLLEEFKRAWEPEKAEEPPFALTPSPRRAPSPRVGRPWGWIAIAVLLAVIALLILPGLLARPPAEAPPAPTPGGPEVGESPVPEAPQPRSGLELEITADKGPSWLEVVVDGRPVYRGLLPQGREVSFSGDTSIAVKFGDAGAVSVRLNGELLGPMGQRGQVLRREFRASTEAT